MGAPLLLFVYAFVSNVALACSGVVRRAVTVSPTPRPVLRTNAGVTTASSGRAGSASLPASTTGVSIVRMASVSAGTNEFWVSSGAASVGRLV